MTQTSAPFTTEQVAALAWLQRGQILAPYQCAGTMQDSQGHIEDRRLLVATADGLVCPVCGYVRREVPAAVLVWAVSRVEGGGEKGKRR